jgi:proteic killer suppression protein
MSYRDSKTTRFADGKYVKEFSGFTPRAEVQLERLEAVKDLSGLPGNGLETLKGNRKGQYSIRIDDQMADLF